MRCGKKCDEIDRFIGGTKVWRRTKKKKERKVAKNITLIREKG